MAKSVPFIVRVDPDHVWHRNIKLAMYLYNDGTSFDNVTRIIERMYPEDAYPEDAYPEDAVVDDEVVEDEDMEAWAGWTKESLLELAAILLEEGEHGVSGHMAIYH